MSPQLPQPRSPPRLPSPTVTVPVSAPTRVPRLTPDLADTPDLFHGPFGLRAGWSLALFLIAALVLYIILSGLFSLLPQAALHAVAFTREPTPLAVLVADALPFTALVFTAVLLGRLEDRSPALYGLDLTHPCEALRKTLSGALAGLTLLSVLFATLLSSHLAVFDNLRLHGLAILRSGLAWLVAFLVVALFEEFFYRGFLQYTLTRGLLSLAARLSPTRARPLAFSLAAVLLSTTFALTHLSNRGEHPLGIIAVFLAGLVFSYTLWRTGSLWWGVGFHAAWDWAQNFLFGVPDSGTLTAGRLLQTHPHGPALLSGGSTGPEGSLLVLPTLALVVVAVRLLPQAPQPDLAPAAPNPPQNTRATSLLT